MTSKFRTNPYDINIRNKYLDIIGKIKGDVTFVRENGNLVEVEYATNLNKDLDVSDISFDYLEFTLDVKLNIQQINGLKEIIIGYLNKRCIYLVTRIEVTHNGIITFTPYTKDGLVYVNPNNVSCFILPLKSWINYKLLSTDDLSEYSYSDFDMRNNVEIRKDNDMYLTPITTDNYAVEMFRNRINKLKDEGYFTISENNNKELYYEIALAFSSITYNENIIQSNNLSFDLPVKLWYEDAVDSILRNELPKYRIDNFSYYLNDTNNDIIDENKVQIVLIYIGLRCYLNLIKENPYLRDFYYSVKCYPDLSLEAMFANYQQILRYKELLNEYFVTMDPLSSGKLTTNIINKHSIIKITNLDESLNFRKNNLNKNLISVILTGEVATYYLVSDQLFTPFTNSTIPSTIPLWTESSTDPYLNLETFSGYPNSLKIGILLGYFNSKQLKGIIDYPTLNISKDLDKIAELTFTLVEDDDSNQLDVELVVDNKYLVNPNSVEIDEVETCLGNTLHIGEIPITVKSREKIEDKLKDKLRDGSLFSIWSLFLYSQFQKISSIIPPLSL